MQQADSQREFPLDSNGFGRLVWLSPGFASALPVCGLCMCTGTDGAGRGKIFLLILLRNDKLRCDYRTVKKELPQRNFQMVMQNYY